MYGVWRQIYNRASWLRFLFWWKVKRNVLGNCFLLTLLGFETNFSQFDFEYGGEVDIWEFTIAHDASLFCPLADGGLAEQNNWAWRWLLMTSQSTPYVDGSCSTQHHKLELRGRKDFRNFFVHQWLGGLFVSGKDSVLKKHHICHSCYVYWWWFLIWVKKKVKWSTVTSPPPNKAATETPSSLGS